MNGGSINGGYLIAGWFLTEHLEKNDGNWGYPHDFGNFHDDG